MLHAIGRTETGIDAAQALNIASAQDVQEVVPSWAFGRPYGAFW
jgi:hypothetical protein